MTCIYALVCGRPSSPQNRLPVVNRVIIIQFRILHLQYNKQRALQQRVILHGGT